MVTLADIAAAAVRLSRSVHCTPVLTSGRLDALTGASLFFKCENFQKVGAFKARGACNAVYSLSDEAAARGVVTHSSGNHGAAVAWAARQRGVAATVVMPSNAAAPKRAAVAAYGATIVECAPTAQAREAAADEIVARHGFELIHPFDDDRVIAGQGTAALELLEQVGRLDIVVTPVGGGGLLAGTAIAVTGIRPDARVYGAEPAGADDAYRSVVTGVRVTDMVPNTVCDGLRTPLGVRNFAILRERLAGIAVASEAGIVAAMRLTWESLKIVVEASCCPPLAAILEGTLDVRGQRVGVILTGGNVDLERLPWQS